MPYSPDALRRRPDVEGQDLPASDAADRLILDEAISRAGDRWGALAEPGDVVVIGDSYGALTLGAAEAGARGIRVHQDPLAGERALAANAAEADLADTFSSLLLDADLVRGARLVLLRLPRSLEALADIAGLLAAHADPSVIVIAGGRLKHMTTAMNDVLHRHFARLDISHARQKSRALIAQQPRAGADPRPRAARVEGIEIRAFGGVFAGSTLDIGTRFLLEHLPDDLAGGTPADPIIDFACGTGVIGVALAQRQADRHIYASDQSAAAVASARLTVAANGLSERVVVARDDLLGSRADASASLVVLNPPFHVGAAVTDLIAPRLFADAGRVLRPGGELWCVWNSALRYRPALERLVGPTRQIARNAKFTVTASRRR